MTVRALRRGAIAASRVTSVPFSGLAITELVENSTTSGLTTYTTGSITPTADALVAVWVMSTGGNTPFFPSSIVGNGITYSMVQSVRDSSTNYDLSLWTGSAASPSAGTVAINYSGGGKTGCCWHIHQWTASVTPSVRQTKTNLNTSGTGQQSASVTLDSAPQASSAVVGGFFKLGSGMTQGTDFTGIFFGSYTSPTVAALVEYDIGPVDGTADCTWTGDAVWLALAAEIGAPL